MAEPKIAGDETDNLDDVRELAAAEYIVFLLSVDTYMRYQQERTGGVDIQDPVLSTGLSLLRRVERANLDTIAQTIRSNLSSAPSIALLEAALRPPPSPDGTALRAMKLRAVLTRGGAVTTKAIFGTSNKARKEALDALDASKVDDPDAALARLSAIVLRNKVLEKWIDQASEVAVPGTVILNPVQEAAKGAADAVASSFNAQVDQAANPGKDAGSQAVDRQAAAVAAVQAQAEEAATKAMVKSGEDVTAPVTKAEAIGLATAAAVAVASDPDNPRNVTPALRGLDPEQLAAATTDGRVLVAAGAGSGKTHTLTSRVTHLVQDRGVDPSRVMIVCFNRKASRELKERLAGKIGDDALGQMTVGTMHSIFRRYVLEYGSPEQKAALTTWMMTGGDEGGDQRVPSRAPSPAAMAGYMARCWKECFNEDPPKKAGMAIQKWMMNDITPEQAAQRAAGAEEMAVVEWYRWTLGFKGVDKNWQPPCVRSNQKAAKQWQDFLNKWREGGRARLGDFSDMILMFRDVLKNNPNVRKQIQKQFDHINVDEAQDLNQVQHDIVDMLSEHVTDNNGKSVFLIGDEIQSINNFVGARPDLFTGVAKKPGVKVRVIGTNYRCLPEIIEAANKLMDFHPRGLPMTARPDPKKPRGKASIVLRQPKTHAEGAIETVQQIAQDLEAGEAPEKYAVLTRTNMEINDFETACIIAGVPYARRGTSSFLKSPETVTVMCYINLAVGQDFKKMQASLGAIFNKPNRFFLKAGESEKVVQEAVLRRARRGGVSVDQVNPLDLFDREGIEEFLRILDPGRSAPSWKERANRQYLTEMGEHLRGMRMQIQQGTGEKDDKGNPKPYTTQALIGDILAIPGAPESFDKPAPRLRDVLMPASAMQEEEADDPDAGQDDDKKPIGNVAFLYQICQSRPGDPNDPADPKNFKAYIDGLVTASKDLRVDVNAWDKAQGALPPEQRKAAPCVTLSTIHKVKGAQWQNVSLVMADQVFPNKRCLEGASIPDGETDPKLREKRLEFLTERQLAYVGMTRAAQSLTVISPGENAYGQSARSNPLFVQEAGLRQGQNVEGKNDPYPDTTGAERTVMAFAARVGFLTSPTAVYPQAAPAPVSGTEAPAEGPSYVYNRSTT